MMPSPASRRSPRRETGVENHKRGRSLEGGLLIQEKDDDLALFNEMQARERDNFLLQSSDDFEDAFSSKLRHFADYKIGVSIPARGESSDLLNADAEKNDYEWLMTPPDTPLFPSLDDEPAPASVPSRGRTRSQPIAISRSSTMERSHRSSRGSASPSRSSPSPRSNSSMGQSRGKPSSAPHTSPISSIRSSTPSRRASTPPSKPSTSVPRSSSPTPRRMSTGSNVSAGARGMSPQKVSRGNSASPRIKAWQANIPGFSSDVPPNLRTSLADRPASYVRGSSPASRNGRNSSSTVNRQSMSPTATRSVSSSYSHERDWFSSHSKGSMASSGDDDVESLQSVTVGSVDQSTPRKVGMYSNNNRSLAYSRRSPKISSSAPKRSFDSVLKQMDNRKAPQNMFRPLLSSVQSSTFYVGKTSSSHSITLRNSSIATGSNMGSDLGASALTDSEGGYYNQDDMIGESGTTLYPDIQEEVFAFDKADEEESGSEHCGDMDRGQLTEGGPTESDDIEVSTNQVRDDLSEADDLGSMMLCSLCGCSYDATDLMEMEIKLCRECRMKENISDSILQETSAVAADKAPAMSTSTLEECENLDFLAVVVSGSPQIAETDESKDIGTHLSDISPSASHLEMPEANATNGEGEEQPSQESEHLSGAGISLLLKRSSSAKGLVVQGRGFTASTILPYDDLSYVRGSTASMRSSIGHGSFSSSSSLDLSSSRQSETRMQRQFSGKKSDIESYKHEVKSQSVGSSVSGTSSYSHQAMGLVTTTSEVNFEGSVGHTNENLSAELSYSLSTQSTVLEEDYSRHGESGRKEDASSLLLSTGVVDAGVDRDNTQETAKLENCEDSEENAKNESCSEAPNAVENATSELSAPTNSSLVSTSEIEVDDCIQCEATSVVVDVSPDSNSPLDEPQEPLKKDTDAFTLEPISSDPVVDILEESTVTVETHGRNRTRSLTLEEATDAILFCSSIVHDLAYTAASIAMEKEREKEEENLEALEGFRPTVTIVGKSPSSDKKDPRSGRIISKRGLKPHTKSPRQKRINNNTTNRNRLSSEPENDENIDESLTRNVGLPHKFDSAKPPKLESKCNCTIM